MGSNNSLCKAKGLLVTAPFELCVAFLVGLGKCLGLSYKHISVYFNLYFQCCLLAVFGSLPLIASIIRFIHYMTWSNGLMIIVFLFYASIYLVGLLWLIRHYSGNPELVFDRCVADLLGVSRYWHLSYYLVNLIIFVVWWLAIVAANIILFLLLL